MNYTVAGVDLGDTESVATVLSPAGDVMDKFTFHMDDAGYLEFADRVPKHAKGLLSKQREWPILCTGHFENMAMMLQWYTQRSSPGL